MSSFLTELSRRNVFRVAAAYVIVGWIVLQVASITAPAMNLPEWAVSFVLYVLMIGFPLAMLLTWAFELTPQGVRKIETDGNASPANPKLLDIALFVIAALLVAVTILRPSGIPDKSQVTVAASPDATQPDTTSVRAPEAPQASIAVLAFANMSSDADQIYFSDGISEEILNVLGQIPELHVTSRSSSFQFRGDDIYIPDVAKQLGVSYILEGSVRKSGTRIRITAQLIDASRDKHLWSETYDRELTDVFKIQDEIAAAIVEALYVHLGLEKPKPKLVQEVDLEAYRLYLLGRHNFEQRTKDSLYSAINHFDQAIAIDPAYALAYSGKADAYLLLVGYGDLTRNESFTFAEPLIEKALELDPDLAEAHASKGLYLQTARQYEAALTSLDRAIELNPNLARAWHWKATAYLALGDFVKEKKAWRRAYDLDPLSDIIPDNLISSHILFGQFEEAEVLFQRLLAARPVSLRVMLAKSQLDGFQGNWALDNLALRQGFEQSQGIRIQIWLGFSQQTLKGFDPVDAKFTKIVRIIVNSFNNAAQAKADYDSLTDEQKNDPSMTDAYSYAEARLGDFMAVINLLEGRADFTEAFPGPLFPSRLARRSSAPLLAWARRQSGDEVGALRLIVETEAYAMALREQGAVWTLPVLEAQLYALQGKDELSVAALARAHKEGYLTWFELEYPMFDSLRDREDFQAIVRAVDAKVNEERAKLGWEPVE